MEEVVGYLKKRSKLMYDINCIQKYIEGGDYDKSLKKTWERYKQELVQVNTKIDEMREPRLQAFEDEKHSIIAAIREHEGQIKLLKKQLKEIEVLMVKLQTKVMVPPS